MGKISTPTAGFQLCALERVPGPALISCLEAPCLTATTPAARGPCRGLPAGCQPPPQAAPLPQPLTRSHLTFFIPSCPTATTPPSPVHPSHLLAGKGQQGRRGTSPACHHRAVPARSSPCGFLFPIKCSRWVSGGGLPLPPAVVQPPCLRQKSF